MADGDKLERLSELANDEIEKVLAKFPKAVAAATVFRSLANVLVITELAKRLERAMTLRSGYRTHSDTWRAAHSSTGHADIAAAVVDCDA